MPLSPYQPVATWPRRNPQPPILQPLPLPPQGVSRPVIGAPASKSGSAPQPPLIVQPIIRVFHSIFG